MSQIQVVYTPESVPENLIAFESAAGAELLLNATVKNSRIIESFVNQIDRNACGPVSLVVLINAMRVGLRIKYTAANDRYGYEESERYIQTLLADIEIGKQPVVVEDEILTHPLVAEFFKDVRQPENGLTLEQLGTAGDLLGFGSNRYYALKNGDKSILPQSVLLGGNIQTLNSIDEFRSFIIDRMSTVFGGIIVNYDMSAIGYSGLPGHFSPLAAYDQISDRMLVMDVWPDTPPVWVRTEALYDAMCTVDSDSGAPRGLLFIHELM